MTEEKIEYWTVADIKEATPLKEEDIPLGNKFIRIREISGWDMQTITDETSKMSEKLTLVSMDIKRTLLLMLKFGVVIPDFSKLTDLQLIDIVRTWGYSFTLKVANRIKSLTGLKATPEQEKALEDLFRKQSKQESVSAGNG